ncbi:MAG TPA: HAD family hydrolase [Panacibacter sp.]|nr:HAD family hydrolase [Panacibacter sp.]
MKKNQPLSVAMSIFFLTIIFSCNNGNEQKAIQPENTIGNTATTDPLPSWNEGALKQSIISYVTGVADSTSKNFIPAADRIATFDNDGTLWAEKPLVQELFAFYRVKKMIAANPALAKKQPFKAVVEKDAAYFHKGGEKALMELVIATHTGMTEADFENDVKDFAATATYPGRNVPLKNITYQPQLELLNYLRANGFKTFICSGGTIEVIRSISSAYYGIPKDQVIGTSFNYVYVDSNNSILRKAGLNSFNDKAAKPVNIQLHIGQAPVFACGNEGGAGDIAMLKYSQSSTYPSFQLIVNHNDSTREYFYQERDSASLKAVSKNNWHVISMKDDWKKVFRE